MEESLRPAEDRRQVLQDPHEGMLQSPNDAEHRDVQLQVLSRAGRAGHRASVQRKLKY